jgi:hypothetical protein
MPLNNCQCVRHLVRDHVSPDSPLLFKGELYPLRTFLVTVLSWIATWHVAYLSRIYSPSPGLGQASKYRSLFLPFCFRVSASCLKCNAHYELVAAPLEPCGPNMDCLATTRLAFLLASTHTHTHTHSLSLSLSHTHTHTHTHTPSIPAAVGITNHVHCPSLLIRTFSYRGRGLGIISFLLFRTCAQRPGTAYNTVSPGTSCRSYPK